jgi:S-adenosylmethionine hydrolase
MITSNIIPEKIVKINIHDQVDTSFPVLDVFVKVACHIARGGTLEVIGKPIVKIKQLTHLKPYVNEEQNQLIGSIIYIDNYGNIVTNISKSFFESIAKGRKFEISARNNKFKKIASKYSDVVDFRLDENKRHADGKGLVIFNSSNYLEIAIYKSNTHTVGGASSLMGLQFRDTVTVNFIKAEVPTF